MTRFTDIGPIPDPVIWQGACVMAFDRDHRALMQLRDDIPGIAAPGQWSLFGGAVEPGETLDQAARREFAEETGIDIATDRLAPLARFASQAKPGGVVHVYRLQRPIAPSELTLGEGAGFAFLTRPQVERFDLIANFRATLLRLEDF